MYLNHIFLDYTIFQSIINSFSIQYVFYYFIKYLHYKIITVHIEIYKYKI
jgi:hypothetical protein